MKVEIDQNKCLGCGLCSSVCEEVFKINDEYKAEIEQNIDISKHKDNIYSAASGCPGRAIKITE